ncbi:MAG: glycosyltransferase [Sphingobacteriales bacterium]|nr:MAG: glycosyltransferase [Sphingobacteriales bacterium]
MIELDTINTPLVSVVICTFNGEKHLISQLNSVVNQTYKNLEILIFDDCSTDETLNILRKYELNYNRVKLVLNQYNLGFIKNFNQGISNCNGSYIALSDQDDIWELNKIELQVKAMKDNVLVYHDSALIDENGNMMNKNISNIMNMYKGNSWLPFLYYNCVSGHSIMIKKEFAATCLPLDPNQYHDRQIAFIATLCGNIEYLNLPLVRYRQHSNNYSDVQKLRDTTKEELPYTNPISWCKFCIDKIRLFKKNDRIAVDALNILTVNTENYFNVSKFIFLLKNHHKVSYIQKKNFFSKLNYIFKSLKGSKLKKSATS